VAGAILVELSVPYNWMFMQLSLYSREFFTIGAAVFS
jgi:hypothetical protein